MSGWKRSGGPWKVGGNLLGTTITEVRADLKRDSGNQFESLLLRLTSATAVKNQTSWLDVGHAVTWGVRQCLVAAPPPVAAVPLAPNDIDGLRTLSLIPAGVDADPGDAHVEVTSSASDVLLWMWNRLPDEKLSVRGDDAVVTW